MKELYFHENMVGKAKILFPGYKIKPWPNMTFYSQKVPQYKKTVNEFIVIWKKN